MLKADHSYYSHISNEEVIRRAIIELNGEDSLNVTWVQFETDKILKHEDFKSIKLVGDIVVERQQRLLGHILRKPSDDIMRKVTCDDNLVRPQQLYERHCAPRTYWSEDNLNVAPQRLNNDPNISFDNSNEAHIQAIKQAATERII